MNERRLTAKWVGGDAAMMAPKSRGLASSGGAVPEMVAYQGASFHNRDSANELRDRRLKDFRGHRWRKESARRTNSAKLPMFTIGRERDATPASKAS